eukprot:TRINITY_DN26905_c0_g1_i1.p1 TRINITY_DN26905_c0_g1~~TRINITY_DN26905_c0_g1_i1.p1  ORF type:complete len:255 (+),score=28.02 TRINITY_DN26905_c0_g1_i1:108-872(+)
MTEIRAEVGWGNGFQSNLTSVSEIDEETSNEIWEHRNRTVEIEEAPEVHMIPSDVQNADDDIYVAVGKSDSSMEALVWTLKHTIKSSTIVYLVHVFPEVRHIPTPLGKLPKSQVSPAQVESYMSQEREKRRGMLHKFLNHCSQSKVNADALLIESDDIEKAVLDLIPVLNIRKLVMGTARSNPWKLKKGSGKAGYIHKNAPDFCEVKIICEGKEVIDRITSPVASTNSYKTKRNLEADQNKDLFSCTCFSTKFM